MLWRVLESCISIVAIYLTASDIIIPLATNKPIFPQIRRLFASNKKNDGTKVGK